MDAVVIHAARGKHSQVKDGPGTVLRIRAGAIHQGISGLLVFVKTLKRETHIHMGEANAQIPGKLRALQKLRKVIALIDAANPAVELLAEKFECPLVVTDGALENLFGLSLRRESQDAGDIGVRQRTREDARRNRFWP